MKTVRTISSLCKLLVAERLNEREKKELSVLCDMCLGAFWDDTKESVKTPITEKLEDLLFKIRYKNISGNQTSITDEHNP